MRRLLEALDECAVCQREYDALGLAEALTDENLGAGHTVTATEFKSGVASVGAVQATVANGHNTNLYTAAA
jgi:hypothetical protein